jgi:hypothetical protein
MINRIRATKPLIPGRCVPVPPGRAVCFLVFTFLHSSFDFAVSPAFLEESYCMLRTKAVKFFTFPLNFKNPRRIFARRGFKHMSELFQPPP